jgi:hypothetical protein
MGKPLVRFWRGAGDQPGYGGDIVAPPRKQVVTEKTNFFLQSRKAPVYSNKILSVFNLRGDLFLR